jgi:NAD(P)-dependent dehydrogenase (short-subunit alcohol dehydrogenase family)
VDLKGRTALVTGGNRGIGFEVCKLLGMHGVTVFLGSRNAQKGETAAGEFNSMRIDVRPIELDVSNPDSILGAVKELGNSVDILVNNAAILDHESLFSQSDENIQQILESNLLGPLLLCKHLALPMKKRNWGRIVNVSTGMAALSRGLSGDSVVYRVTKLALNGLTLALADSLRGTNVLVNSVDPGWVRTAMGGPMARKSPEEGAREIIHTALLPDHGPTGAFFRNGKKVDW